MQITITSTLTEEQALILAKEKGYEETVNIYDNSVIPPTVSTTTNTQYPFDFLKNVYENMIKEDIKNKLISYNDQINIDKKNAREKIIKDEVDASFN